jgi:hypothetical protein
MGLDFDYSGAFYCGQEAQTGLRSMRAGGKPTRASVARIIDMMGAWLPEDIPAMIQDRSRWHGAISDAAAGARTYIFSNRSPALFSALTFL